MNFCRADGDLCQTNSDCCNNSCDTTLGRCRVGGSCAMQNDPCGGLRSCCDTLCVLNSQDLGYCTAVGGCRVQGEPCKADLDCCSFYDPNGNHAGACAAGSDGILRCQKTTPCLADGEVCGGQGASNDCCSKVGAVKNCWQTSTGAARCFPQGACIPAGSNQECSTPDQCCGHICVLVPGVGYRCQAACLPLSGQDCSAMSCGAGLTCVGNVCVNNPPCSADADCCSGLCQNGNCVTSGQSCKPIGGTCTGNADCCQGNCVNGFCAKPG
jgi:hypothetical protein